MNEAALPGVKSLDQMAGAGPPRAPISTLPPILANALDRPQLTAAI